MKITFLLVIFAFTSCSNHGYTDKELCEFQNGSRAFWGLPPFNCENLK